MRRVVVFAAAILAAGVAVAATSAATTVKLTTKQTSSTDTPNGFTFKEDVFQNGKKVGTDRAVCKFIIPTGSDQPTGANCKITISLTDGKIRLSVKLAFDATRGPLKVTGGTGENAGATGTGTYRNLSDDRTAVTLNLN